ncbi:Pleckstrin homology domain-containing protein [Hygrophoropsis aurantiaca]|uniref:Pleckstrin homology domain-containing protein n=1 Tax=Hygrophoropsis aurantiaca TaxID=72124 RepID=A0ACB8ANB2_9AGAM|nr:Pleckstrin homology domain-containing protein [Hygrophoropsis aurantiaca]
MKASLSPSGWPTQPTLEINHNHNPGPSTSSHQPLTPTYSSPRTAPKPPAFRASALKGFQSVFQRKPPRTPSYNSLNSAYSAPPTDNHSSHPYASMPPAPVPVVSPAHELVEDEDECPVCLEPLSFSFRLPGEKPHVVPECGHALHEACFSAVYGPPAGQARSTVPRKSNLGVCGVCRRPMKLGDGDSSKLNKLAALTGMGDPHSPALYPGRDTPGSRAGRSPVPTHTLDATDDDPIDHAASVRSNPSESHYIVAPSIQVRPEFSSISRTGDTCQPLTCIVVIELPARRGSTHVPGPLMADAYSSRNGQGHSRHDTEQSAQPAKPIQHEVSRRQQPQQHQQYASTSDNYASSYGDAESTRYAPSNGSHHTPEEDSPFNGIVEDLRHRIADWKGHALSGLGPLQMYDLLSVRRDMLVREFFVYLFKEAIICVVEEKKKSLGRFLSSPSFNDSSATFSGSNNQSKGILRLKGRIYVRHIKRITANPSSGDMSLTIEMEDERLDSFILVFKDRSSLEAWKNQIQSLVTSFQIHGQQQQPSNGLDIEEFGGSGKAARVLSGSTGTTASTTTDSLLGGSSRSTMSSSTSHGSMPPRQMQPKLTTLGEEEVMMHYDTPGIVAPHVSSGPSNSLAPLPHPPLDLILIVSLPPPNSPRSTAALKIRVIKASLDFILASLGIKDRLSLVTFEVGSGGRVRKTPYLCVGRAQSRGRLSKFIDEIGRSEEEQIDDEFLVRASKDEKTDVVTAVNHGLDVVLQRKSRNPISGMVLVSDAADSTRRAQMDLVLARAEAANMPIHSFGYGRSHDPASLWLMSNHTSGTYTFVKDWYDLRGCLAGCVGGMMSVGLLNMKLHIKIIDGQRFRIRKVSGGPSSILSIDGHNVDIDVGELRYGECKEMLLELELDNTSETRRAAAVSGGRAMNATDQFVQSMGLDSLAIDDPADLVDGMMDRMIDEVPVFEVDGSFFDPAASKQVSRLAHPVLLTITLLPQAGQSSSKPPKPSDPVIVRRRMELLASDMITRALVLVSRKNFPQAQKIMNETKRILHTVLQSISKTLPPPNSEGTTLRNRKEILTLSAVRAMQAILQDLQILAEALEENVELFAHDQRNFGAQQAMILRDQKSWSGRSATERLFWTMDNSIELVSRSTDWVARD